jgi:hypothetical protein
LFFHDDVSLTRVTYSVALLARVHARSGIALACWGWPRLFIHPLRTTRYITTTYKKSHGICRFPFQCNKQFNFIKDYFILKYPPLSSGYKPILIYSVSKTFAVPPQPRVKIFVKIIFRSNFVLRSFLVWILHTGLSCYFCLVLVLTLSLGFGV